MSGMLRFTSFQDRDHAMRMLLEARPTLANHLIPSSSLPNVIVKDIDDSLKERLARAFADSWHDDVFLELY